MASQMDWDEAAETLGLHISKRDPSRGQPLEMKGQISGVSLEVGRGEGSVSFTAVLPAGPWDDHQIMVQRRGMPPLRKNRYFETTDSAFDERFVVRFDGPKADRPAAHAWVSLLLTAARRNALIDLQEHCKNARFFTASGKGKHANSEIQLSFTRKATGEWIAKTVGALVACAEVLIADH